MPKKPLEEQTIHYRVSLRVGDLNKALLAAMLPPIQSEQEAEQWRHHLIRAEDLANSAGQSENERFKAIAGLCYPLMLAYGQSGTGVLEAAGESTEWSCDLSQPPEHYESLPDDLGL